MTCRPTFRAMAGNGQFRRRTWTASPARGRKFSNAFVTAPVCSACRSALITGMYQTSIGDHHHRSGRGIEKIHLPDGVELVPALFQKAGYYTCIGSGLPQVTRTARRARLAVVSARRTTTLNGMPRFTTARTGRAQGGAAVFYAGAACRRQTAWRRR